MGAGPKVRCKHCKDVIQYCLKGEIRWIRGRIKFVGATHGAPFPSMVVIFRPPGGK